MSDILFEVDGFIVKKDRVYTVVNKPDSSAPTGFQEERTTKTPSDGVDDVFRAPFNEGINIYDTGLYEYSPCYKGLPSETVKITVKDLIKNVIRPFMSSKGIDSEDTFSQKNFEFWDAYKFRVANKKFFNTNDPIDVFELYYTLRKRKAAPKDSLKNPIYNQSEYLLIDSDKDIKVSEQKSKDRRRASTLYLQLESSKFEVLIDVLNYMDFRVTEKTEPDSLYLIFEQKVLSSTATVEEFIRTVEKVTTERGREEVMIYALLKSPKLKNDVKKVGNMIEFKGVALGPDFKTSAKNLTLNKELEDLKTELLFIEDED